MIRYDIPLPRLLRYNSGAWETERVIYPSVVSINEKIIPLSYATMDLPMGETVPKRGYIELFTPLGSAGVYRVRSPQDAYGQDVTTAELEHAIVEVGDWVVTQAYDKMETATVAMQTIFSHYRGGLWQLGSVAAMGNGQVALNSDHDRVLEAMISLLDQVPNCMMQFDFSTTPWTVSIVQRGATVAAEGRLSRNINSAKIIYDDTELCTRGYYSVTTIGEATIDEGSDATTTWYTIDSDTQSKWGIIEREIPVGAGATLAEAQRVAAEYMAKHKNPRISVSMSAEDLSATTGEPLDSFVIGKLFRLALPDYDLDEPVEQVITGRSWSDVYGAPENMTVNLADEEDTAVSFIHDLDSSGGTVSGSGSGGRKKQRKEWQEYWTDIQQDNRHIELMAVHVDESDRILQQAGLDLDSDGVLIYSQDEENNLGARIQVLADRASMSVGQLHYDPSKERRYTSVKNFPATGESGIAYYDTTADEYYIWEWKNPKDHSKGGAYMKGKLVEMQNGEKYINALKAGEIAIAINESGDTEATINATKVYINPSEALSKWAGDKDADLIAMSAAINTLTADKIDASNINTKLLNAELSGIKSLSVNSITAGAINVTVGGGSQGSATTSPVATQAYVSGSIWGLQVVDDGNGNYHLQGKMLGSSSTWTDIENTTFSRATQISANWSGTTSANAMTVQTNGQNLSYKIGFGNVSGAKTKFLIETGTPTEITGNRKTLNIPINLVDTGEGDESTIRYTTTLPIDCTEIYRNGVEDAEGSVPIINVSKGNWQSAYISFRPSAGTGTGAEVRLSGVVNTDNSTVRIWDVSADQSQAGHPETGALDTYCSVNVESVYTKGFNDVSAPTISLPAAVSEAGTRSGITITAATDAKTTDASGSNSRSVDKALTMSGSNTSYVVSGKSLPCVELRDGTTVIGRISTVGVYNNGGKTARVQRTAISEAPSGVNPTILTSGQIYSLVPTYKDANGTLHTLTSSAQYVKCPDQLRLHARTGVTIQSRGNVTIYPGKDDQQVDYDGMSSVQVNADGLYNAAGARAFVSSVSPYTPTAQEEQSATQLASGTYYKITPGYYKADETTGTTSNTKIVKVPDALALQAKTGVTIAARGNQTISPDANYDGMSSVVVNADNLYNSAGARAFISSVSPYSPTAQEQQSATQLSAGYYKITPGYYKANDTTATTSNTKIVKVPDTGNIQASKSVSIDSGVVTFKPDSGYAGMAEITVDANPAWANGWYGASVNVYMPSTDQGGASMTMTYPEPESVGSVSQRPYSLVLDNKSINGTVQRCAILRTTVAGYTHDVLYTSQVQDELTTNWWAGWDNAAANSVAPIQPYSDNTQNIFQVTVPDQSTRTFRTFGYIMSTETVNGETFVVVKTYRSEYSSYFTVGRLSIQALLDQAAASVQHNPRVDMEIGVTGSISGWTKAGGPYSAASLKNTYIRWTVKNGNTVYGKYYAAVN